MKFTKKHIIYLLIVIAIAFFISTYQLPYYVYKPGSADALNPIVNVEGGYESKGDMHLVTVRGGQATPVQYLWAKVLPNHEIYPLNEVRPEGVSEDEYFHAQLQMMESSQEASKVVAYKAAGEDITINYDGVYVVAVVDGMPADGKLKSGDRITGIDGKEIKESKDLINYVENKQAGDSISLEVVRDEKQLTKEVKLEKFKEADKKVGIGIRLVTDRSVKVNPKVNFSSGSIGGPSAGLMFSLEIYDQLNKNDLTSGYQIAGTGEVDYNGNVLPIGGIDKKIIAADQAGCNIFFAPNEDGAKGSNYEVAKKTAEEIDTDMKIVPVDTFEDALKYLKKIESK
ncbi:SepM family pheromone-processing serine protease [Virgibacillus sp. JSM 102003]|uniref:SepM family pheromone-processing serine protease n=1 Tax=Virgibacillus sp. JSM 102003 TaxID=1562108 RepID=UPI0035C220EE